MFHGQPLSASENHLHSITNTKQTCTIYPSATAYDSNGEVVTYSVDRVCLTEGQTNMIVFNFFEDVSVKDLECSYEVKDDGISNGEPNAVKMLKWEKEGNHLYVTLEQTGEISYKNSSIRILLYNGGKMVGVEDWFLHTKAPNLSGIGSTDVMDLQTDASFDSIKMAYVP